MIKNYLDAFSLENQILIEEYPEICVEDDYLSGGYGKYLDGIKDTIHSMFVCNGILEYLKKNGIKNANILFIYTGGAPLF